MGDLLFIVYFDFETTTGNSETDDKKMYVISYCQIHAFQPSLNLEKIVIFRSLQQNFEKMMCLNHFSQEHIPFFDQVTMRQVKDPALSVLSGEKTTSLSEFFALELKFTIDTFVKWFNAKFKQKFLELSDFQKQAFVGKIP